MGSHSPLNVLRTVQTIDLGSFFLFGGGSRSPFLIRLSVVVHAEGLTAPCFVCLFVCLSARCRECQTEFCAGCRSEPYHLGFTCEQFRQYQQARHCRFCSAQLKPDNTAPIKGWAVTLQDCCNSEECMKKREHSCALKHPVGTTSLVLGHRFCSFLVHAFVTPLVWPLLSWYTSRYCSPSTFTMPACRLRQVSR